MKKQTKGEGLNLAFRLGMRIGMKFLSIGGIIDELTVEAFKADLDDDGELSLREWVTGAKSGNSAISPFLNPGTQIREGAKAVAKVLSDNGLIVNLEEYAEFKREIFSAPEHNTTTTTPTTNNNYDNTDNNNEEMVKDNTEHNSNAKDDNKEGHEKEV